MKAFTTIAAALGVTSATPIQHIQYGSTGLRNINQHSSNNMMANTDMHNMSNQQMTQMGAPVMDVVTGIPKPVVNPNQYLLKDSFGNYAFGYSTQNSEVAEEGNAGSKKGHFSNIMADGKLRRVDYVADDQGFHILRDTADNTGRYIKREAKAEPSVEPDHIRTTMTSYMDSSSLMDDRKGNLMDMTSDAMRSRNNQMSSIYKSPDMMNHGMMDLDMATNMMGRELSTNAMGHDMTFSNLRPMNNPMSSVLRSSDIMAQRMPSNMIGRDMFSNTIGRDLTLSMIGHGASTGMMTHDMDKNTMGQTMYTNMLGLGELTSNMKGREMSSAMMGRGQGRDIMERNMMGQDMYSNTMDNNKMMTSNIMISRDMNQMIPVTRKNQRMQIQTMPSQSLNNLF